MLPSQKRIAAMAATVAAIVAAVVIGVAPFSSGDEEPPPVTVQSVASVSPAQENDAPSVAEVEEWNTALWVNKVNADLWFERAAEIEAEAARKAEEARQAAAEEARRQRQAQATTTTTSTPPATQAAPPAPASSGACGGNLPPCYVLHRESGGDARIWNGGCYAPVGHRGISPCGSSSASGLWQFVRGTWAGYGGYVNAADAPASVQNAKAAELWAGGAGCGHWNAC